MTKSRSLALRIAQILEEHTDSEVLDAISILKKAGTTSDLLKYLASATKNQLPPSKSTAAVHSSSSKPLDQITSKAVRDLENTEPDKYKILVEFEKLVRQGKVLETNESVRRFGETVSKDFRARTARKDNISALMSALAILQVGELDNLLKRVLDSSPRRGSNEYHNLAEFLIRGKK